LGDKIKMGRLVACMRRGEVHIGFWWGNMRERDHLEDSGIDGRVILNWIFKKWMEGGGWGSVYWIDVAQGRIRWWILVNKFTNHLVP
jgi:hypothetical protein